MDGGCLRVRRLRVTRRKDERRKKRTVARTGSRDFCDNRRSGVTVSSATHKRVRQACNGKDLQRLIRPKHGLF